MKKKLSPKQIVLRKFPKSYSVTYDLLSFIYREPVNALPRGLERTAVILGRGFSARQAWEDAAKRN
jgi:hypothetical protein